MDADDPRSSVRARSAYRHGGSRAAAVARSPGNLACATFARVPLRTSAICRERLFPGRAGSGLQENAYSPRRARIGLCGELALPAISCRSPLSAIRHSSRIRRGLPSLLRQQRPRVLCIPRQRRPSTCAPASLRTGSTARAPIDHSSFVARSQQPPAPTRPATSVLRGRRAKWRTRR